MKNIKTGGNWIWTDSCILNQHVQFIHKFQYNPESSEVYLHISSDSQYVAWINGKLASFGQYADYPEYKVFDRVKICHLLDPGENILAILGYCVNEDSWVYRLGQPGIWFEISGESENLACSDTETLCRMSEDYYSGDMERITLQLSFSFKYNANLEDGWLKKEFVLDQSWVRSTPRTNSLTLFPRPIEKLELKSRKLAVICSQGVFHDLQPALLNIGERMQYAFMSFRELHAMTGLSSRQWVPNEVGIHFQSSVGQGIFIVIDLECEETGLIQLELDAAAGTVVDIGYGEHLDDMRVRTSVGESPLSRCFAAQYVCREGRQTFTHYLQRVGCRYLQLNIYAESVTFHYAGLLPTHYPIKTRGSFHCSDGLHNKIYDTAVRTLLLCMHEHYEDCPWREQALYSMDSRNQMLFGYYCFGEYDFAKASIRLMGLSQRNDGLLELCSPARTGITIPSFSLTWIMQLYEYVLYSGDKDFGREMYNIARTLMHSFTDRIDESGLLLNFWEISYWNFYEWERGLDGGEIFRDYELPKSYDAPLNALCSFALGCLSKFAQILNELDDAQVYQTIQNAMNESIAKVFWDNKKNLFCTFVENGEQHHFAELTQALVVYCGACPDKVKEIVLSALCAGDGKLVPLTLSSNLFKYEALLTMPNKFGPAVLEEIAHIWGGMLFQGATSFWETERGAWDFSRAGSLCHGWSAVPIYIYHAYVLGMKPASQGFTEYNCRPVMSSILRATGIIPASDGKYEVSMISDSETIKAEIKTISTYN